MVKCRFLNPRDLLNQEGLGYSGSDEHPSAYWHHLSSEGPVTLHEGSHTSHHLVHCKVYRTKWMFTKHPFKKDLVNFIYVYMCLCVHACMHEGARGGQKRTLDPPELDDMCPGNSSWVLWQEQTLLTAESISGPWFSF